MDTLRKAVIPAAGKGTRFLPATKAVPKEMLPIVDKPTIQYVVEEAVQSGLKDICFVTCQGKSAIEDHFDYDFELAAFLEKKPNEALRRDVSMLSEMIAVCSIRQKQPLGLGHAVLTAQPFVGDQPFAVLLADDIIDHPVAVMQQMLEVFQQRRASMVAVQEVPWEAVSRYGVVEVEPAGGTPGDRLFRVEKLVEKPSRAEAPSNLAVIGRYILTPGIFNTLERTEPGAVGEIQLTDGISGLVEEGQPVYALRFQGVRYDAGDKLGFLIATVQMALKHQDLGPVFREYLKSLEL
ncbi:MAG: UTP--glucose-1-phosphate uridylyltransferase GalU [Acidobacteriota bacterium]